MSEVQEVKKPRYSYTALSTFEHCPFQFYLKYIAKRRSEESALHLELGNLAHKIKELISKDLMAGNTPDYEKYEEMLLKEGYTGLDKANGQEEILLSCDELRGKYFEDWIAPDTKSGMTYEQKLGIFVEHLKDEEYDPEWRTIGAEVNFEVEFDDVILFGIIDKIQENSQGQLRIVDYKSSKKVFTDAEIRTPLQMLVYHLAVKNMFPDREIVQYMYDFVFLGETQIGGTKGWIDRGLKKLRKLIAGIDEAKASGVFKPCPSPLCHWCDYCETKDRFEPAFYKLCPYHSQWTPDNKTYEKAREYKGEKAEDILNKATEKKAFWF